MRSRQRPLTPRIAASPLLLRKFLSTMDRERRYLQGELSQVAGLMPLLMKPRNRQPWTQKDKQELHAHLKRLSDLSPYLAVAVLPGGFAMLPILAWWLDRRRLKRVPPNADAA